MQKLSFWVLLILVIPTLGCSLLNRVIGSDEQSAPVTQSRESEQTTEQQQAVAEDQQQQEAASPADDGSTETGQFMGITGLGNLSSYRVSFIMDFDGTSSGQPSQGHIEMSLSSTKEPPARRLSMTMDGTTVEDLGGGNKIEFYEVGDKIYMYSEAAGAGQWMSMAAGTEGVQAFQQGFFAPDENLELPETAQCNTSQIETVNGVSAYPCTFDESNIDTADATYDQLEGQAWIAQEGNYIVRFTLNAQGFRSLTQGEDLFDIGNVSYEYNLQDINADFTIEPPQEALDAPDMFGGIGGGETPELPVPDDAENVVSISGIVTFYTPSSVDSIVTYYRQELPAAGWTEDESSALVDTEQALLSFDKEGQNLTITINTEADGRVNVGLITSQ